VEYQQGNFTVCPTEILTILPAEASCSKAGGTGKGNDFCLTKYLYSHFKGFFNIPQNLNNFWRFTSPPKLGMLRIFIALTNPKPLARFQPANLGPNGKHANHYTTNWLYMPFSSVLSTAAVLSCCYKVPHNLYKLQVHRYDDRNQFPCIAWKTS
jgi:hypothetical protein